MSEILTFVQLGVRHIVDIGAMDHMLFLVALAAIYRIADWREIVKVVTAFTVGHSITLAAAVLGIMPLSQAVVEFMIPVTIVATCIENIIAQRRAANSGTQRTPSFRGLGYRPVFATIFGLVHGAGFGGYLKSLFVDRIALPLLGFNLGIEIGQILILSVIFTIIWGGEFIMRRIAAGAAQPRVFRIRVVSISVAVLLVASRWAVERAPW